MSSQDTEWFWAIPDDDMPLPDLGSAPARRIGMARYPLAHNFDDANIGEVVVPEPPLNVNQDSIMVNGRLFRKRLGIVGRTEREARGTGTKEGWQLEG